MTVCSESVPAAPAPPNLENGEGVCSHHDGQRARVPVHRRHHAIQLPRRRHGQQTGSAAVPRMCGAAAGRLRASWTTACAETGQSAPPACVIGMHAPARHPFLPALFSSDGGGATPAPQLAVMHCGTGHARCARPAAGTPAATPTAPSCQCHTHRLQPTVQPRAPPPAAAAAAPVGSRSLSARRRESGARPGPCGA